MLSSGQEWIQIIPVAGGVALLGYVTYQVVMSRKQSKINVDVKKDSKIVVDKFDIEDLGNSVAYCRCWRSSKFPYCDGSHSKFNQESGDNVGPLCLNRKTASS